MTPAEQKQAATKKRLDAARSKASEYQQNPKNAAPPAPNKEPQSAGDLFDDFDSDSDDEQPSRGGGGYGMLGLLMNKKKKESFYKNAAREVPRPEKLPEIEIVRGKKVVSERRIRPEE
jgi:hypothetical protein